MASPADRRDWPVGEPEPDVEPLPAFAGALHPVALGASQRTVGGHGRTQLPQQAPRTSLDPIAALSTAESQPDEAPAIGDRLRRRQSGGRRPEDPRRTAAP